MDDLEYLCISERKSDLNEEFMEGYGYIIKLVHLIVEHLNLPRKDPRLLGRWINRIDDHILMSYPFDNIPKITMSYLSKANDALDKNGFVKIFDRYNHWLWRNTISTEA